MTLKMRPFPSETVAYWRNRVALAFLLRHTRPEGMAALRFALKMCRACLA
jgi:hypothetical protein